MTDVLEIPEKGEIHFQIISNIKFDEKLGWSAKCLIYGKEIEYDILISDNIYKGMLATLKNNNITVDDGLKIVVGKVFTIDSKRISLRPDLESLPRKIKLPQHLNGDLYYGNNLVVMKMLQTASIDLIYGDPPFFSGRNYKSESKIDVGEIRSFDDTFNTLNDYLKFLYIRLIEMKRLLKPTGSIYIHLDWHASHYVKVMMDKIFGYDNFKNNIVWCYNAAGRGKKKFSTKHDDILWYSKTDNYIFNLDNIKIDFDTNFKKTFKEDEKGLYYTYSGKKYYVDGKIPEDWWCDIPSMDHTEHSERVNYPTQKPEALLERIIKASSNEGDTVADFYGGSGTTAAVCQRLDRKWITCDKSQQSIDVIKARLLGNKSVKDKGYQANIESIWLS